MNTYDVLIVGGGAAGLSGALVLSRARRAVLVVDSGAPRNAPAAHMHGYLSRDGMPPSDLLKTGRAEVTGYGGTIIAGRVNDLVRDEGTFHAVLVDGQRVRARRVLVTTGLRDELPHVPGLSDRWANDVLHCPYCHGWEVRDRAAGVIWNGPETTRYVQIVRQWTRDLVLFAPNGALTAQDRVELAARAISLVEGPIDRLVVDDDVLTGVAMAAGSLIPRQVLFVPPRPVPHSELLASLGAELDQDGWATTAMAGATTVSGVWVAGNVANPRAQVITAAGEGSAAAIAINADLVDEDVRAAVDQVAEGLVTNPA